MLRGLGAVALVLLLAGCPTYDRYSPIVDQTGLVPADQFARYGAEQAQSVAIARALGASYTGPTAAEYATQVTKAAAYARSLPGVRTVVADSTGYILTVTFKSGWKKAIVPINDGVPADQTTGLPTGR
jgi:hypothetical protein